MNFKQLSNAVSALAICAIFFLSMAVFPQSISLQEDSQGDSPEALETSASQNISAEVSSQESLSSKNVNAIPTIPEISATNAILINGDTGEILYEKAAYEKAYPASTTKILTALVTIEVAEALKSPLDQMVTVPDVALGIEGSSIYLKQDEEISIETLLYGLMMRSGNDAAVALSEIIGGTTENFTKMMNKKAAEIGCLNSKFINPNGLFDESHYTTAYDLALISKAAMENETFRKISEAKEWEAVRSTNDYNYFYTKNKVLHQYEGGNGVKIGYTESSGRTLVASAEREGVTLICVVLDAPDWFNDSYEVMDYGFASLGI